MIWKSDQYLKARNGETREKVKFCFGPCKYGPNWYWLESVLLLQEVRAEWPSNKYKWHTIKFLGVANEAAGMRK